MISTELEKHLEKLTSPEDELLYTLNRETHIKQQYPQMLSGHLQGQLLTMLSQIKQPLHILEVGTFTGYSTICLARGLKLEGTMHTIEIDAELADSAKDYFTKADLYNQIIMHNGNALEIIPKLDNPWDLIFLDADKENYLKYYHLLIDKMASGGIILADNVFWDGKAFNPPENPDKETRGIIEFNTFVSNDKRVEQTIIPLRDGLMIIRKK